MCEEILPQQSLRRVILEYILLKLDYNFNSWYYNISPIFSDENASIPWRISHTMYNLLFSDLDPPFVDYAGHYSSVCPIKRPPKSSVSCGNQDSTVQESSLHKCGRVFGEVH